LGQVARLHAILTDTRHGLSAAAVEGMAVCGNQRHLAV
jgi:hypothetical protein